MPIDWTMEAGRAEVLAVLREARRYVLRWHERNLLPNVWSEAAEAISRIDADSGFGSVAKLLDGVLQPKRSAAVGADDKIIRLRVDYARFKRNVAANADKSALSVGH